MRFYRIQKYINTAVFEWSIQVQQCLFIIISHAHTLVLSFRWKVGGYQKIYNTSNRQILEEKLDSCCDQNVHYGKYGIIKCSAIKSFLSYLGKHSVAIVFNKFDAANSDVNTKFDEVHTPSSIYIKA